MADKYCINCGLLHKNPGYKCSSCRNKPDVANECVDCAQTISKNSVRCRSCSMVYNFKYDGDVRITKNGYRQLWNGERYISEMVMVMEQYLGRKIDWETEKIERINDDNSDNRVENLRLVNK